MYIYEYIYKPVAKYIYTLILTGPLSLMEANGPTETSR